MISRKLFNFDQVDSIDLSGRGGKERLLLGLLSQWNRVNAPLHDYEIIVNGEIIHLEVKKQNNLQWFDSGKYYKLKSEDRGILMLFIFHKKGRIEMIAVAKLGEFLDWLFEHCSADGWTDEVLKIGANLKKEYPSLQFKARAYILTILNRDDARDLFDVIYKRK